MGIFAKTQPNARGEQASRRADPGSLSIVAPGAMIVGDVTTEGVLKVEGTIEGTVRAATQLLVTPGAVIRGDVFAHELVVGGEIRGSVRAEERVEVQAGALVDGDIRTQRIHIADGGRVNGQISMETPEGKPNADSYTPRSQSGVAIPSETS